MISDGNDIFRKTKNNFLLSSDTFSTISLPKDQKPQTNLLTLRMSNGVTLSNNGAVIRRGKKIESTSPHYRGIPESPSVE